MTTKMTKVFFRPCTSRLLLLFLFMAIFSAHLLSAVDALLPPGMKNMPEMTLVMIDGRENEIFTRRPNYVAGMDIINIHLAHLKNEEYLWKIDFRAPPEFADGVFNLYLDTDLDTTTGIATSAADGATGGAPEPLTGADLSVTFSRDQCVLHRWAADGSQLSPAEPIPFRLAGHSLYFRTTLSLPVQRQRVSLAIAANTHSTLTAEKPQPAMRDTTRRQVIHRFELATTADKTLDLTTDSDGDGLPDHFENLFGTDPRQAETFTVLSSPPPTPAARQALDTYVAGMDMTEIAVLHVAEDRYLFRTTFAAPPAVEDMVHIIYLDVDNDTGTGRDMGASHPGNGTDAMLFSVAGRFSVNLHGSLQQQIRVPEMRQAVIGQQIYFCVELPLQTNQEGATFGMYAITHTAGTPRPPMSDSIPRVNATGVPLRPGKKQPFLGQWQGKEPMQRAYGLDVIRPVLARPDTIIIPYDKLELAGFDIDYYTNRQYGHLKALRERAAAGHVAPKGRYHVAFLIFDQRDGSEVGIKINDREIARASINVGNLNYWLHWLQEPIDFAGDEYVELVALGGKASHPLCKMVFLAEPPPGREQSKAMRNLTVHIPAETISEAQLSWTSDDLVPSRLEYGVGNFAQVWELPANKLVHYCHLKDLSPQATYQARAVGVGADGQPVYSEVITFQAAAPAPPAIASAIQKIPLTVVNENDLPADNWLVRNGIPFPQGALATARQVRLLADGREIPVQAHAAAWWPDYSIKWLTINFVAEAPANGQTEYQLEFGRDIDNAPDGPALASQLDNGEVQLQTGKATFRVSPAGELLLGNGQPLRTRIAPVESSHWATGELPAKITIEENGPIYARIRSAVTFPDDNQQPAMTIEYLLETWRGAQVVKLEHSFLVQGKPLHSTFKSISLDVPLTATSWTAALHNGDQLTITAADRVFQRREHEILLNQEPDPQSARLTGSFQAAGQLVSLRHFWEQYPKAVSLKQGNLCLELCPEFAAGYYDSFPFNKHSTKIHFYLHDGVYKFRRGMRKTHQLLIGAGSDSEAKLFQRPLLATATPAWYCDSKAFYEVAPRDLENFPTYESHADRNFAVYRQRREQVRDYGMLNFGDWFGERGVHWGNSEYDNTAAFALQYIRSSNQECYFLADEMERHVRDIDMRNWDANPSLIGHVYIHQVGHHGGYYDRSPPGEDAWGTGSGSVTHAWSEGHIWHGFLSGNPEAVQAGLRAADYYIASRFNRYYDFRDLRDPGWHLIMNAAAYHASQNPIYLNASRVIMSRVLEFQDTIPRPLPEHQLESGRTHQVGGWSRMLVPGHCHCEPRHRGNANFMLSILLSGIKYYYAITGEEAAKKSLIAGAYNLLDECYSEKVGGFRYTSCPAMRYGRNASPILVEAIATAYRWTLDPKFVHPLQVGLPAYERGSAYGSAYYYRCGPRLLADMKAAGLRWDSGMAVPGTESEVFKKPDWLEKASRAIVVQAEDFRREGSGQSQKISGRPGSWGDIVSYWHAELGHWLEWDIEVAVAGEYAVTFRYATSSAETCRDFLVNGELPHPAAAKIHFPTTGGFGTNALDWRELKLLDQQQKPLLIKLKQGKNVIRMSNKKDGMAFDFMVLYQP